MKYSVAVRNAGLDAKVANVGSSPTMRIWDGDIPSSCVDADSGIALATLRLPPVWMSRAVAGAISKAGKWSDSAAARSGVPRYFRIYAASGACCIQGEIGREMKLSSAELSAGQLFTVTDFTIRDANG